MNQHDRLMTFIKVVETGSFSAAANALNISGVAVSKQISLLEQAMEITLLHRSTRSLQLTEAGEEIYQYALKLREHFEMIDQYTSTLRVSSKGTLNLVASVAMQERLLATKLHNFLDNNPSLNINIRFTDDFPDFSTGKVDLAYGFTMKDVPATAEDLICRSLLSTERHICASPSYLKKHGTPKSVADFSQHCYIAHSKRPSDRVMNQCIKKNVKFKRTIYFNTSTAMLTALTNGWGIGYLTRILSDDALSNKKLIKLLPSYSELATEAYIFYQKSLYMPLKLKKIIEAFLST